MITPDDIFKLLDDAVVVRLTDDNNNDIANLSIIKECIKDAEAEISLYLDAGYQISAVGIVTKLTRDITIYNLYSRIGVLSAETQALYGNALELLKQIKDKKIGYLDTERTFFNSNPKIFTR